MYHNSIFLFFVLGWIAFTSGFTRRWCSFRIYSNRLVFGFTETYVRLLTAFGNKINNMLFHYVKLWGDFNMRPVFSEEAHKAFYFGPYKWKNRQFNSKQIKA